jgi:hypothetical protein
MNKKVDIRPYRKGDEEEIISLLQSVFVDWPKFGLQCSSLDHWKWKYVDNPLKSSEITLAESDGKIVGCSHGFYLKLKFGDKSMISGQGTDLAVDGNYRGEGIMGRMLKIKNGKFKENGVKLTYEVSSNPSVNKWKFKKEGSLQFPYELGQYIKIKDIGLHLKMSSTKYKVVKKYGLKTIDKVTSLKNFITRPRGEAYDFDISEVSGIDDSFNSFWDKVKNNYEFIVERDANYLKRRYCDKRGGNYTIIKAKNGDELLGYIIVRVNNYVKEYPHGYIVDLLTIPNRLDVAYALIQNTYDYFLKNDVNIIHALAIKGHPYETILSHNNFVKLTNLRVSHIVNDVGEEATSYLNAPANKLHFVFGDTDWI